jgi:hypothetical protein
MTFFPGKEKDDRAIHSEGYGLDASSACHLLSRWFSTLKMEVTSSSEMSVDFQRTTRRYIPVARRAEKETGIGNSLDLDFKEQSWNVGLLPRLTSLLPFFLSPDEYLQIKHDLLRLKSSPSMSICLFHSMPS